MTFLSSFPIRLPQVHQRLHPPRSLEAHDVSLIIPVRDNQRGLDALLNSIMHIQDPFCLPAEILVVDNNSRHPIEIPAYYRKKLPIKLLQCSGQGPASARNVGAQHALGCWLWFCDSDCILTDRSLQGYRQALNGAIGYAGWVQSSRRGMISQYYDEQHILIPPNGILEAEMMRPAYVITANALVYQPAFHAVGGFRETWPYAAGEDIDFGVRLWSVGVLSYAPSAVVQHDFEPDLVSFLKRFIRYGRGNRRLSQIYDIDLMPHRFPPQQESLSHWILAQLQWAGLRIGYTLERV
jgi:glycosyltransferase involved in cell wall biosynthesis